MPNPLRRGVASSQVSDWFGTSQIAVPSQNLWTPYALRNLVAWWDSSVDSTFTFSSGTDVSQWDSLVGGHSFVQATAAKQPSRSGTLNGLTTVVFNGSSDSMSTSATVDMTGSQYISTWAVFTATSGSDQGVLEQTANYNNTAGAFRVSRTSTDKASMGKRGSGSNVYATFTTVEDLTTTPMAFIATHDGTLTSVENQLSLNLDFRMLTVVNANTDSNNINQTLFLASRNNSSLFLNGIIAEVGVCTSVFTLDERIKLNEYLRAKWGI